MGQRVLPPTYVLVYLVAALALNWLMTIARIIRVPYNLIGIPLIILGVVLNIWADGLFKQQATTVKPFETPSALITAGPFRLSLHPMYLGFVAILLGVAVLLGSATAFAAPIALVITVEALFIPSEENSLQESFGEEYTDYASRVRRWM